MSCLYYTVVGRLEIQKNVAIEWCIENALRQGRAGTIAIRREVGGALPLARRLVAVDTEQSWMSPGAAGAGVHEKAGRGLHRKPAAAQAVGLRSAFRPVTMKDDPGSACEISSFV